MNTPLRHNRSFIKAFLIRRWRMQGTIGTVANSVLQHRPYKLRRGYTGDILNEEQQKCPRSVFNISVRR